MKINTDDAKAILLEESELASNGRIDQHWKELFKKFSQICESTSKTHIAFLGTALLAKTVRLDCDALSVKAGDDSPGAYSARSLGHGVLVPLAPKLDINLGVTGREPLNNQPYFRVQRVTPDMPVRGNNQVAIDNLIELLNRINQFASKQEARAALRAFIYVRRQYCPRYDNLRNDEVTINAHQLSQSITTFVADNSEGGRRAQAVVAGLLDLFAGMERVSSGRINDPDRHLPGDVGISKQEAPTKWEKVFEVRDKAVSDEDVYLFVQKAIENDVNEVAVVCVHPSQSELNTNEIQVWAFERGVSLTFFLNWFEFVEQIAFWSEKPQIDGLKEAHTFIYNRLIEIEVSEEAVNNWVNLLGSSNSE
ncbi:restriction endonuclease, SacI family [Thermodesulfobacteriota bacterium]